MQQPTIRDQADVKDHDVHLYKADESTSNTDSNKDHVTDVLETDCALVGARKQHISNNNKTQGFKNPDLIW